MRGSKPGERRDGRKKGTPNRVTAEKRKAIEASGLAPLDYMLSVMRDPAADERRRDEMPSAIAFCGVIRSPSAAFDRSSDRIVMPPARRARPWPPSDRAYRSLR